jgi:3-hydroxyacyl-CoA dehydrogenase
MVKEIKKVAVIGAGTMGSGIAAQLANAGIEVVMLDLTKENADKAIQRMVKSKPTDAFNNGFMIPENAANITTGSSVDDLDLIADCDWIIESILVPNEVRQKVYKEIEKIVRPDALISSNTSMMQTDTLTIDQSDAFKKRFMNTHFFNPVRYMHLLEVIANETHTDPAYVDLIKDFGDRVLGKKVVECKDMRGFIANRIGIYAMERATKEALAQDMTIEDVDAIMGKAFGFPHLGLFKLADEVGLDVVAHVRDDFAETLPADDHFVQIYTGGDMMHGMMEDGYFGNRKADSKGGYYRLKTDESGAIVKDEKGKPIKQALRLETGVYEDRVQSPYFKFERHIKKAGGFQNFFESDHRAAKFAWPVLRDTMLYVLDHAEELANDPQAIDEAMRAGFNWEFGPFELMDQFGADWFAKKLEAENIALPVLLTKARAKGFYPVQNDKLNVIDFNGNYAPIRREEGVLSLDDIKRASKPLFTHNSASLWDIGDGVVCLEFHSEQNSIDPSTLYVMNESIKFVNESGGKYKAMVVYNDAERFSVGANIKLVDIFAQVSRNAILRALGIGGYIARKLPGMVEELIYQGQAVYNALNQSPFPVVGAPKGNPKNMAFGGGCEVLLHCDAIQAGPEQVMVLPEVGLGLIPAWGGSARYLDRAKKAKGAAGGPMPAVIQAATMLADPMNAASTSSQDAKKKLWMRENDGVSMNPDRVLADAKARALSMIDGYKPEELPVYNLPGLSGKGAIRMNADKLYKMGGDPNKGVNHVDVAVVDALANVLTGGETITKDDIDAGHVAEHGDHLKKIMDERDTNEIGTNPQITQTLNGILQLERDAFMTRFHDSATKKRIGFTMSTNKPLREQRPDPAPTPKEIRDAVKQVKLTRRAIHFEPLEGKDGDALKAMADMTSEFYAMMKARSAPDKMSQGLSTLSAIQKVFKLI